MLRRTSAARTSEPPAAPVRRAQTHCGGKPTGPCDARHTGCKEGTGPGLAYLVYVFVVMEISTRRVVLCNVTESPTLDWVKLQIRDIAAFGPRIPDRDRGGEGLLNAGRKHACDADNAGSSPVLPNCSNVESTADAHDREGYAKNECPDVPQQWLEHQ